MFPDFFSLWNYEIKKALLTEKRCFFDSLANVGMRRVYIFSLSQYFLELKVENIMKYPRKSAYLDPLTGELSRFDTRWQEQNGPPGIWRRDWEGGFRSKGHCFRCLFTQRHAFGVLELPTLCFLSLSLFARSTLLRSLKRMEGGSSEERCTMFPCVHDDGYEMIFLIFPGRGQLIFSDFDTESFRFKWLYGTHAFSITSSCMIKQRLPSGAAVLDGLENLGKNRNAALNREMAELIKFRRFFKFDSGAPRTNV